MTVAHDTQGTTTSGADDAASPLHLVAEAIAAPDFIGVRAELIRLLGSDANRAIVLTRIHWRASHLSRDAVEDAAGWWWRATHEQIADETGLSIDQVRRAVGWLSERGYVEVTKHYQAGAYDQTRSYRLAIPTDDVAPVPNEESGVAPNVPSTKTEKTESVKHPPSTLTFFDAFYEAWPKKIGKRDAHTAFFAAVKRATPERIVAAAVAYRDNPHLPPKQFIPNPATWLRRDGWEDELPGPRDEVVKHAGQPVKPGPNERTAAILGLKDPRLPR